jgi:hypothetical protein
MTKRVRAISDFKDASSLLSMTTKGVEAGANFFATAAACLNCDRPWPM